MSCIQLLLLLAYVALTRAQDLTTASVNVELKFYGASILKSSADRDRFLGIVLKNFEEYQEDTIYQTLKVNHTTVFLSQDMPATFLQVKYQHKFLYPTQRLSGKAVEQGDFVSFVTRFYNNRDASSKFMSDLKAELPESFPRTVEDDIPVAISTPSSGSSNVAAIVGGAAGAAAFIVCSALLFATFRRKKKKNKKRKSSRNINNDEEEGPANVAATNRTSSGRGVYPSENGGDDFMPIHGLNSGQGFRGSSGRYSNGTIPEPNTYELPIQQATAIPFATTPATTTRPANSSDEKAAYRDPAVRDTRNSSSAPSLSDTVNFKDQVQSIADDQRRLSSQSVRASHNVSGKPTHRTSNQPDAVDFKDQIQSVTEDQHFPSSQNSTPHHSVSQRSKSQHSMSQSSNHTASSRSSVRQPKPPPQPSPGHSLGFKDQCQSVVLEGTPVDLPRPHRNSNLPVVGHAPEALNVPSRDVREISERSEKFEDSKYEC